MATTREANAHWEGPLLSGQGSVSLDSSHAGEFPVTWAARSEKADGRTSPEELIAAAHSTCFSMALSHALAGEGITGSHLTVRATVPGMSAEDFAKAAEGAKENCPVSKALTGTKITLDAALN